MSELFGTDGIRGIAGDELDADLALRAGAALAKLLSLRSARPRVLIGRDTRLSGEMLSAAFSAGVCSVGGDVFDAGIMSTPGIARLTLLNSFDSGVVISASHNPFEYNGIKIFGGDGYKLSDADEELMEKLILTAPRSDRATGENIGRIFPFPGAARKYIDSVTSEAGRLDGMKIALDTANGAVSEIAGQVFTELGACVTPIGNKPDGKNINRDCGSTHPEALSALVGSGDFDLGIAFDGDADRCICVDENGKIVDGDVIMAICALDMAKKQRLAKNTVVGTVMTNLGFIEFCRDNGLNFVATKVGDRNILDEMRKNGYSLGGEPSGHVIFGDPPRTGDGLMTAVRLCSILCSGGGKLSESASAVTLYPHAELAVTVSESGRSAFGSDRRIAEVIEAAKVEFGDAGRLTVRPSGTEPVIRVSAEHPDRETAVRAAEKVAEAVKSLLSDK